MSQASAGQHSLLPGALQHLREHGGISLRGTPSVPYRRWQRRRRISTVVFLFVTGLGLIVAVAGLVLRHVSAWALLVPVGGFLMLFGLAVAGVLALVSGAYRFRRTAEEEPVMIDRWGIRLRGTGPVEWSEVGPPEYRRIVTKNDVSGLCAVMPLTEEGRVRINASPSSSTLLVGPKPYLRIDVPYLLLPGVEGFTEEEVVELFGFAHQLYRAQYPVAAPGSSPPL